MITNSYDDRFLGNGIITDARFVKRGWQRLYPQTLRTLGSVVAPLPDNAEEVRG